MMTADLGREQKSDGSGLDGFCVAVVGGGFAGLCVAIGLLKQGIRCRVYEAGPVFSEIGAGITFAPNGVKAMGKLHPSIESQFLKHATSNGHGSNRDLFWDCRDGRTDEARLLCPVEGFPYRSIHRATFLSILASLLPSEAVSFNKRLVDLVQLNDHVQLSFADGSSAAATVIIGCDGVRSLLRSFLTFPHQAEKVEPVYSHIYSYRGVIRMERAVEELGETLATTAQNYVGQDCHIITYPIEDNTALNIVLCKYDPRASWPHEKWQVPATREKMLSDFENMGQTTRKICALVASSDQWAGFDLRTPLNCFYDDKLLLVGDAAHCTTPHTGAGASLALEDAYVLSELMQGVCNAQEAVDVFQAFDLVRRPRTERVIEASRTNAAIYQFRDPSAEQIDKGLLHLFDWIWDIDFNEHLAEARALLDRTD